MEELRKEKVFKDITRHELKIDPDFACIVNKVSYLDGIKIMFSRGYMRRTLLFLSIFIFLYNAGFMFMQWFPTLLVKEGMVLNVAAQYQQMITIAMLFGPLYVILFGDKGGCKISYAAAV